MGRLFPSLSITNLFFMKSQVMLRQHADAESRCQGPVQEGLDEGFILCRQISWFEFKLWHTTHYMYRHKGRAIFDQTGFDLTKCLVFIRQFISH